jgi:pimeloyl-ACP methyl ester carboxylesterase
MGAANPPAAASNAEGASNYYEGNTAVRVFRVALAATQKLAPGLAVRAASRIFGSPLPPKWLQRRHDWGADWRIERWPFEDASVTLYTPAVAPEAPVALLVHGWGGHARQMLPLAEALAQQGLRPMLLEMPAHGRSAGSVSNLPQFARAIEYVAARLLQQGFHLRVLAAHSLGANAAAFATSRGLAVERLVLLAPPASPYEYTRYFAQVFGLAEATRAAMQKRIETREAVLMRQLEPEAVGPRIRVPTLVVHDRGDRVNPFSHGKAFARAIRGAELLPTEGLGHRRILKDAHVLGRAAIFCG